MPKKRTESESKQSCVKSSIYCTISKFLSKFGINIFAKTQEPFYQILKLLKASAQKMSPEEKNILTNFLQFGHKTVKDVMIPRADIASIQIETKLDKASSEVIAHSHTRTVIYGETLDDVLGFVHIKDLFGAIAKDKDVSLKKLMRPHLVTTASTKLIDLLVEMRKKRTHIAIVFDEYGGTEGMATIEDIVEEIVGEIEDEHDDKEGHNKDYTIINQNTIITSARLEIKELEQIVDLKLLQDNEDVDTIGGLVMLRVGHVPNVGDIVNLSEYATAEVLDSNSRIVKRLKITFNNES